MRETHLTGDEPSERSPAPPPQPSGARSMDGRQRLFSSLCAGEDRRAPNASNLSDRDRNSGEQSARLQRQHYFCRTHARCDGGVRASVPAVPETQLGEHHPGREENIEYTNTASLIIGLRRGQNWAEFPQNVTQRWGGGGIKLVGSLRADSVHGKQLRPSFPGKSVHHRGRNPSILLSIVRAGRNCT